MGAFSSMLDLFTGITFLLETEVLSALTVSLGSVFVVKETVFFIVSQAVVF